MEPSLKTLKVLFAQSRDQCAFPGCHDHIIEPNSEIVNGMVCHIRGRSAGGPRFDPAQTDAERSSAANLILLCARHHNIVDSSPLIYKVADMLKMKQDHVGSTTIDISPDDVHKAEILLDAYRRVYHIHAGGNVMIGSHGIQAESVTFKTLKTKPLKMMFPTGTLGSDALRRNYIKYLIDRYHVFARAEKGPAFKYSVVYGKIKKDFGCDWQWTLLEAFGPLSLYLQNKINKTVLGKVQAAQGTLNFSDFDSYTSQHRESGKQ